ncbi:hypothetical protein NQ317_010252 [Molorchus minor]|uniref:Reverse transcriptase Ty1/copia-type domain-containing protein n=1 Tax=Molorchus minor TaxID=1323400 RepID=A0ABQ9JHG3_9CUCU|nr:hypothetical protein NQ317_010252 [Molorchus minor]
MNSIQQTYGTSSAPFLWVRCLHHEVIMNDFYVDDLLSGSNEASELIQLQRDVNSILGLRV